MTRPPPPPTPFPYTTLFRSREQQPPPRSLRGAGERCEGAGDEARLLFAVAPPGRVHKQPRPLLGDRSEEHTSELQSLRHLVCRLLLEKKKKKKKQTTRQLQT